MMYGIPNMKLDKKETVVGNILNVLPEGTTPLVKGLIVALCGGLGSIPGALLAAALIGTLEALTGALLGGQYVLMTQFTFVIAVLIVRPRGIAGLLDHTRE